MIVLWAALGFMSGALPFSVWLGRLALRVDVRRYGDGNPGAANAWKADGWRLGFVVLALDYFKGAIPVALAHLACGISGASLVAVALAPIVGHVFSPLLSFRGGKGIAVSFGVWTALLPPAGPLVLGATLTALFYARANRAWAPLLAMCGLLAYVLIFPRQPVLLLIWLGNFAILVWRFRGELLSCQRGPKWQS